MESASRQERLLANKTLESFLAGKRKATTDAEDRRPGDQCSMATTNPAAGDPDASAQYHVLNRAPAWLVTMY